MTHVSQSPYQTSISENLIFTPLLRCSNSSPLIHICEKERVCTSTQCWFPLKWLVINTTFQSLSISAENGESGQGSSTGNSFLKEKQEHLVQHSSRLQIWFIVDNGLGVVYNKLEPERQALSVASFHRKTHRRGAALPSQMVGKDRTTFAPDTPRVYGTQISLPIRLSFTFLWENIWQKWLEG